jgi:hypothetical protein
MNFSIKLVLGICLSTIGFIACKKHTHDTSDTTKPVITMAEPMANDTLSLASDPEIHLEFTTTDESGLHSLKVLLIRNNTDTLFTDEPSVHDLKVYGYHEHFEATGITTLTPMKVIVIAEDHGGNVESKIITFFVEP